MKLKRNCINCNIKFSVDLSKITEGNGKYCSENCSKNISALFLPNIELINKNICKHCGQSFKSLSKLVYYCSNLCKQKNYRIKSKSKESIKFFYKKFKDIPCQICGWKESSRDLHHIIPVSEGGKNSEENLIVVCPNHHRMIHFKLINANELLEYKNSSK